MTSIPDFKEQVFPLDLRGLARARQEYFDQGSMDPTEAYDLGLSPRFGERPSRTNRRTSKGYHQ